MKPANNSSEKITLTQKILKNNPVNSFWFPIVAIIVTTALSIVTIIGYSQDNDWKSLGIEIYTMTGVAASIIGLVLIARQNNKFIYFAGYGLISFIVAMFIGGVVVDGIKRIVQLIFLAVSAWQWSRPKKEGQDDSIGAMSKIDGLIGLSILGLFILIFGWVLPTYAGSVASSGKVASDYLNSISFGATIFGVFLIFKKKREAQVGLIIGDSAAMISFIFLQNWVMVATQFIFVIVDIFSALEWYYDASVSKKKSKQEALVL